MRKLRLIIRHPVVMAHNIPTSVSLRGWGSPSLHRWTCAAVLPEVTPGCYFPLPSFGPGSLWGLFAVISQPLKWISSSDYFGHTGGPCGYRGTLGPEVWKGFALWSSPVVGHYGMGFQERWVRRGSKHTFFPSSALSPKPVLSYHIFATYIVTLSSPVCFRAKWNKT